MAAKKSKGKKMSGALKAFLKRHGRFPKKGELGTSKASGTKHHAASKAHHGAAHHSGGGSTDRKPKPRVAVYLGLGITAVRAVAGVPATRPATITAAGHNVAESFHDTGTVVQTYAPAALGLGVSIVADAVGANKRLARMRLPFRV